MLKLIRITKEKITVQDLDTNKATLNVDNAVDTDVIIDNGELKAIEITLTLDQARELAKALGVMEIVVTE